MVAQPAIAVDAPSRIPAELRPVVALTVASLVGLLWLLHRAELGIALFAPGTIGFMLAFCGLGGLAWIGGGSVRPGLRLAGRIAGYYGLFALIGLIGAIGSYPVASFSHGYVDGTLQQVDELLGFDWLAWYAAVAAHPALQVLGRAAYQSVFVSPAILLAHFARTDQRAEAARFFTTVWIAAMLTLALYWWMPAVGPLSYLWHGGVPYLPLSELWQPQMIPALRQHLVHTIDPGHIVGLVSAPSFHTAADVMLIAFGWRHRPVRALLVPLNLVMLLAIPVEGTHYLSDMLLGVGVAVAGLWIAPRLLVSAAAVERWVWPDLATASR